jgi:hypothetical protein
MEKSLKQAEAELKGVRGWDRLHKLRDVLYAAWDEWAEFERDDIDDPRAKKIVAKYSKALLKKAYKFERNWDFGNAVHDAHTALGLLAFKEGDYEKAGEHLIKSVDHKGSPQLISFGPTLTLFNNLAVYGEVEVCREFIDRVEKWVIRPVDNPNSLFSRSSFLKFEKEYPDHYSSEQRQERLADIDEHEDRIRRLNFIWAKKLKLWRKFVEECE